MGVVLWLVKSTRVLARRIVQVSAAKRDDVATTHAHM
jgi:hypothetical protein